MIKIYVSFILIFKIFNIVSQTLPTENNHYFGYAYPDSTPVIFAPDIVSKKGRLEHGISFTPDHQEVAFGILNKNDFSGKVYYAKQEKGSWSQPKVFEALKGESVYLPYFSPDGKSMLYAKTKGNINEGVTDIWKLNNQNGDWNSSQKLNSPINTKSREASACLTLDNTIYFSSNRNCEGQENCYTADLFYSELENNEYNKVEIIKELQTPNDEESIFISPREEYIIFCSYTDNNTGMDLYISYSDSKRNWLKATILDSTINSSNWDRRPFVTMDNNLLFFTQLEIGENGLTESDIYWVNTSKLFKPFVYNPNFNTVVTIGRKFKITLPVDYFKDIDDPVLKTGLKSNEFNWLSFDAQKRELSGLPTSEGEFELTFYAKDRYSNLTEDVIKLKVIK